MNSELAIKTERLRALLAAEKLGGVLLGAQHNFAWLTGGRSNAVNTSVENGACHLLVRADGRRFVLASNIEMPRMLAEEISAADFEPVEIGWQAEKAAGAPLLEKARALLDGGGAELATDLFMNASARPVENLVARCRYALTAAEVERFRALGRDAGAALGRVVREIAPGATEREIARRVRDALAARQIETIVALVGADDRIARFRHPVPTAEIWKNTLLIAVCARRAGLVASLSRIVCAGAIPAELARRTEAAAFVFARFLTATRPGARGADIYEQAARAYAERGFADEIDRHHQGGAAGYKSREWVAHPQSAEIVEEPQAFAWNPSITGTKVEETVLAGADGIEYLTPTPGFPSIETTLDGVRLTAPGILKL